MTREEQEQRRELKRERKALDRAVTAGDVPHRSVSDYPTRWNYGRRIYHAGRSRDGAYRDARRRIGELHQILRGAA